MLKKLRLKFILITMTIVVGMLMAIFVTVYHFTKADLNRQADTMLERLTQGINPQEFRNPIPETPMPYFVVQIYLNGDMQISGYTSYDLMDEELMHSLIGEVYRQEMPRGTLENHKLMYSITGGNGIQRIVFLDISGHDRTLSGLVQSCGLIGMCAVVVFLLLSILLARWSVKPVQTAWDQQKQFISDASHELKTPLTVIMSNAELLQQYPENQAQLTGSILVMSQRMRTLVEGMLELARSDSGQNKIPMEHLDLSWLVETAVLPFEPMLFERQLLLETEIEPNIRVSGSQEHLQRVLGVLLDNAAKYATPGTVTVTLHRNGADSCVLSVANPGVPVNKQQQGKIFDRFYRGDTARAEGDSFGLGLPIAKSIVESHRGKIWVQSNPTGNCFCIQLPTVS